MVNTDERKTQNITKGKAVKPNYWKRYGIWLTAVEVLTLFALLFIFFRADYDTKLLVKLGLKNPVTPPSANAQKETNWTAVGWNNCLEKLDYDADIVFFGDSITRNSDFRSFFPHKKIVNLATPGDSILDITERVDGVAAVSPEQVFVLGGINGLRDYNVAIRVQEYRDLLKKLRDAVPNATIYVQSVLPISTEKQKEICRNQTIIAFNEELEKLCDGQDIVFIDLFSLYQKDGSLDPKHSNDGVHLVKESYDIWANTVKAYIK